MVFHFLSRSSSPARNFINRLRNCKSLPANRPWLIIQEINTAKSHHAALSRFFSAPSLKESGSALLHKKTTTGDGKGQKSARSEKRRILAMGALGVGLMSLVGTFLINFVPGRLETVKPVFFEELSKLLEAGHVDHILVAGSLAIVYVKRSGPKLSSPLALILYDPNESQRMIDIESPESFTEKLEGTQAALGIPCPDYVPVTYVNGKNEGSAF